MPGSAAPQPVFVGAVGIALDGYPATFERPQRVA